MAHLFPQAGVGGQLNQRVRKRVQIVQYNQSPRSAVDNHFRRTVDRERDCGDSREQRLNHDARQALPLRCVRQDV